MSPWTERLPAAALAACVLGLAVCPFLFIATGVLSEFSAAFHVLMLPPFLLGSGFALIRFLSRPSERRVGLGLAALEATGFAVTLFFLAVISSARLMIGFERFGCVCAFFLASAGLCLPVVLARRTALEQRLNRIPRGLAIVALVAVLAVSGGAAIAYAVMTPAFI